ncbi:hypothetical protein FBZ89_102369 [Nitrospirillum amazonense]|uniref:Uncharacterized protein n=1 Tax=Nitrospirillum amazonense TaxID=28077 RepID=A0A560FPS7_9PROT|nr:hypothetical protein FBZ89_102369 [Nitrospirillum amazonense]
MGEEGGSSLSAVPYQNSPTCTVSQDQNDTKRSSIRHTSDSKYLAILGQFHAPLEA